MPRPTTSPAMSPMAAYVTRIFFFARGLEMTLRSWLFFNAAWARRGGRLVGGSGLLKVGQRVRRGRFVPLGTLSSCAGEADWLDSWLSCPSIELTRCLAWLICWLSDCTTRFCCACSSFRPEREKGVGHSACPQPEPARPTAPLPVTVSTRAVEDATVYELRKLLTLSFRPSFFRAIVATGEVAAIAWLLATAVRVSS